tara:strand:- start:1053 stop:1496 length:444 start_codon:yes stop_codon:yes gene_type:complete
MIQVAYQTGALFFHKVYLNLYDEFNSTTIYTPLITITSQLTGKSKTFKAFSVFSTNKERWLECLIATTTTLSENLSAGVIILGTTDFPLGFYDMTIYENSSNSNLDPSGLNVVYTGLMNLYSTTSPSVTYSEYTTNDSDTESVYITI